MNIEKKGKGVSHTLSILARTTKYASKKLCQWSNYELNLLLVIAMHNARMGPSDVQKFFGFLQFNLPSLYKLGEYVETCVGEAIVDLSEKSMTNKHAEKCKRSISFFNLVINKLGEETKIPLILKIDMQWMLRGHLSPSGTIHAIGALTNGIVGTRLLINNCSTCKKYDVILEKLETSIKKCISRQSPCYSCFELVKSKQMITDIIEKMNKIRKVCTKKKCPILISLVIVRKLPRPVVK